MECCNFLYTYLFPSPFSVLCVDSLAALWDPANCQVCNWLIETHFNKALLKEARKEASTTLGKWVGGFRKNAETGPFLLGEEIRATFFPSTAKRFVFDPLVHVGGEGL